MNGAEAFTKEQLAAKIQRFSATNAQLVTDKMKTEKIKVNLEANRVRLLNEKNSLVAKKKELRVEIVILNITGLFNISIYNY